MGANGRRVTLDAMAAVITPILTRGKLVWAPITSGSRGDLAYTVGEWTWTGADQAARGAYVTLWKRQADGFWKVLYDVGDPVGA